MFVTSVAVEFYVRREGYFYAFGAEDEKDFVGFHVCCKVVEDFFVDRIEPFACWADDDVFAFETESFSEIRWCGLEDCEVYAVTDGLDFF